MELLLRFCCLPQYLHVGLDEFTAFGDVFSGFEFVPREHPDLDVGSDELVDCLRDIVLEAVLHCCLTKEEKVCFDFFC